MTPDQDIWRPTKAQYLTRNGQIHNVLWTSHVGKSTDKATEVAPKKKRRKPTQPITENNVQNPYDQ